MPPFKLSQFIETFELEKEHRQGDGTRYHNVRGNQTWIPVFIAQAKENTTARTSIL